jgi:hypothetical protein
MASVSCLGLAPHGVTMVTTKHSPAEIARKKSGVRGGGMSPRVPCEYAGLPLAVAEQDHQLRGAKIFERKCCLLGSAMPTQPCRKKRGAARIISFKI